MPRLRDVVITLERYRGRYEYLDAFADDIEELGQPQVVRTLDMIERRPRPIFFLEIRVDQRVEHLAMEPFPDKGIIRFCLSRWPARHELAEGTPIGIDVFRLLLASAMKAKQGLLGDLVLGMLVGGKHDQEASVERVLAMHFDPVNNDWRLYDGPLLRWAKRTIDPAAA